MAGRGACPVAWLVKDKIPLGDASTLDGDGGLGKTQAAIQLAVAVATGEAGWLGWEVTTEGAVLFLSAEEPENEMRRRTFRVAKSANRSLSDLHRLAFWFPDDVGDCLLARQVQGGAIVPTDLFNQASTRIQEARPALVIVDNVAAVFGGEMN